MLSVGHACAFQAGRETIVINHVNKASGAKNVVKSVIVIMEELANISQESANVHMDTQETGAKQFVLLDSLVKSAMKSASVKVANLVIMLPVLVVVHQDV